MRLVSVSSMLRKVFALMVILTITGVAPATAVIGFCAKMPCCFGEAQQAPALGTPMADCCTTINCYEAPSLESTASAKAKVFTSTMPVWSANIAVSQVNTARQTFEDTSPPITTSQRLSSLSILLI